MILECVDPLAPGEVRGVSRTLSRGKDMRAKETVDNSMHHGSCTNQVSHGISYWPPPIHTQVILPGRHIYTHQTMVIQDLHYGTAISFEFHHVSSAQCKMGGWGFSYVTLQTQNCLKVKGPKDTKYDGRLSRSTLKCCLGTSLK